KQRKSQRTKSFCLFKRKGSKQTEAPSKNNAKAREQRVFACLREKGANKRRHREKTTQKPKNKVLFAYFFFQEKVSLQFVCKGDIFC
ncbi:MAG: hypothetical protein IJ072_01035, partial [Oscillospiraceae bacterium]|nr:hypothetical protein [Oscillospiraceae bacterium]